MDSILGTQRINIHKVKKVIDANKQVTPISKLERIVSITSLNDKQVSSTITNNIATIISTEYNEGDEVYAWLVCIRSMEKGSICEQVFVQEDEDKYQEYLNS